MKQFFSTMVSDVDGQTSSKRVITFAAFILLAIAFLCNIFLEIKLQEFVFDGMMYLVCVGLGVTCAEKFSRKKI